MYATIKNFLTALCFPRIASFFVRGIKGRKRRRPPASHPGGIFLFNRKRRNFCMTLISAAAVVALPASAMRDVLIHKGNMILPHGNAGPYYYEPEALRQMNFYQHASRVAFHSPRQYGKTILHTMNYADVEKRVSAWLDKKDQELLKTLSDFEDAESWRKILPRQKRA